MTSLSKLFTLRGLRDLALGAAVGAALVYGAYAILGSGWWMLAVLIVLYGGWLIAVLVRWHRDRRSESQGTGIRAHEPDQLLHRHH